MKETTTKRSQQQEAKFVVNDKYTQWKSLVPVLYDWLANHNLVWPSLSCRWGPQLDKATYKNCQRLYLSEQTDGTVPNTLVIALCDIVKPRVAAAEHISQFNEESRSPFVKKFKTIIHPGENQGTTSEQLEQVEIKRTIPKGANQSKVFKTKKIFVGGIPSSVNEDELKSFFSKYGKVVEHQIIRDHETNHSRGFGFVIFDVEEVVDDLLSQGTMIDMDGTQVEIKKVEPKKAQTHHLLIHTIVMAVVEVQFTKG